MLDWLTWKWKRRRQGQKQKEEGENFADSVIHPFPFVFQLRWTMFWCFREQITHQNNVRPQSFTPRSHTLSPTPEYTRAIAPLLPNYLIPQIKSAADFADSVLPECTDARCVIVHIWVRGRIWILEPIFLFKTAFSAVPSGWSILNVIRCRDEEDDTVIIITHTDARRVPLKSSLMSLGSADPQIICFIFPLQKWSSQLAGLIWPQWCW